MKKYLPLLLAIILSCNEVAKNKKEEQIPKSEFEITELGLGTILLGDPFESVDKKFSKVDTLTMSSEGINWPAKKVRLDSNE